MTPERPLSEGIEYSRSMTENVIEGQGSRQTVKAAPLAERETLAWWFPQINNDEKKSFRIWLSRRSRALMLQISIASAVFVVNLALTAFAVSKYQSQNGVGVIYDGDCNTVKQLDQWLHLLINLLSTGLLSASNYCMQLQAAPTRDDIDRAHEANTWLDIGIPSWRNLGYISGWRRFTWILLAFSSVPLHLLYNSAVFQSLASNDYTIAVVKDSFLNGSTFNLTTAEQNREGDFAWDDSRVNPPQNYTKIIYDMQQAAMSNTYEQRNVSACFDLYDDYWAPQGNGVFFVKNESVQTTANNSLLMYVSIFPRYDDWAKNMWAISNGTGSFVANSPTSPVTTWYLGPPHYEVSHCLVQRMESSTNRCRFEFSPPIMFAVCSLNFLKGGVMICVWVMRKWQNRDRQGLSEQEKSQAMRDQILYTLGDAIASFMRKPDPSTKDMCLASKEDFLWKRPLSKQLRKQAPEPSRDARAWILEPRLWMSSASLKRWCILLFICCVILAITGALLGLALHSLQHRKILTTMSGLWSLGFGALTPFTYLVLGLPRQDPAGLISNVLIANLPQLFISIIYIFYNTMLSTFLVQREFSLMYKSDRRKPLRVSEPTGIQRSSYFISLPLRYGVPLYATSAIMHWLISQSLFLARITAIFPDGEDDITNSFSTCGYSPIAVIIKLSVQARSNPEHWFTNYLFGANHGAGNQLREADCMCHDPRRQSVDGQQVQSPGVLALQRIFEDVDLDLRKTVPEVRAVTSFVLRRQVRVRFTDRTLQGLFEKLPRLNHLVWEPWREGVTSFKERLNDKKYASMIEKCLPKTLKSITMFEDFNEDHIPPLRQWTRDPIDVIRNGDPAVGAAFASRSLSLEQVSASYVVDARHFFQPPQPLWTWHKLQSLALTSQVLTDTARYTEIASLLHNAGVAALRMPSLNTMVLWNGRKGAASRTEHRRAMGKSRHRVRPL
ncbi:hypothetical protein SUNI508_06891 [Seiridium unicorne]|uniref:Uncharacterized protein n=1 Tax=Seiridium unicorne TaxID=138068 RepID=A0ABR2UYX6_9PEZI